MWSVFGKRPAAGGNGFPKPEWPPIQELDSIDLVGKRDDGGPNGDVGGTKRGAGSEHRVVDLA